MLPMSVYWIHVVQGHYSSSEIQGSSHCLALLAGRRRTCSELCSLTPPPPASAEAIFLAASTFPSAQRSTLTVSWCSVLQRESSRTTEDASSWSLATPWRVLQWWESSHTLTHTQTEHRDVFKQYKPFTTQSKLALYVYLYSPCSMWTVTLVSEVGVSTVKPDLRVH